MRFLLLSLLVCISTFATNGFAAAPVELKIASSKTEYFLGGLVQVRVSFGNRTSKPIEIGGDSRNWAAIKIASESDPEFRLYAPPSSGFTLDGYNYPTVVKPRTTVEWPRTILWNYKPQVSHLNSDAAAPYLIGRIPGDYAFPTAGAYLIKYVALIHREGVPVIYESEPLRLSVIEPVGSEALVWESIKANPDISRFVQASTLDPPYFRITPKQQDVFVQIERSLGSFRTASIRNSFATARRAINLNRPVLLLLAFDSFGISVAHMLKQLDILAL